MMQERGVEVAPSTSLRWVQRYAPELAKRARAYQAMAQQHHDIMEADHGALKQVIRPTRGFQTMKTARATIKGFEIMRMIRRGQCLTCKRGVSNEVRFVNSLFGVAA